MPNSSIQTIAKNMLFQIMKVLNNKSIIEATISKAVTSISMYNSFEICIWLTKAIKFNLISM